MANSKLESGKTPTTMKTRDNFPQKVKTRLAMRVGYRCSFPGCKALTVGPSDEKNLSTSSVGMACHISAASLGMNARRYNPKMTKKERKSISNGIWMCYKHGKLVDTDETRFTVEILKTWKELAENIAKYMLDMGCGYNKALKKFRFTPLACNLLNIDGNGNENQVIGDAIQDSCIHIVWGVKFANSLRDFVIEYTRNAFAHGQAKNVNLEIKKNCLILNDNGKPYNPRDLLKFDFESGGTIAIKYLFSQFNQNLIFTYERIQNNNILTIAYIDEAKNIFAITPCSIDMKLPDIKSGRFSINIRESCNEVFIVLPKYFTLSDISIMIRYNPTLQAEKRQLIFIVEKLSDKVSIDIAKSFPNSQIVKI